MTTLPITEFLPAVHQTLAEQSNLVLQAEPGAGKSTALPLSLIDAAWLKGKKIVMLEPRRVAAKSIAHYLAKQLGEPVGQRVGYQIKNDRKTSKDTVLEIVTEGILTRRLQQDPEIEDIGLIIFDEFHERSLHADLSLLLALEIQQAIRDDIKLMIMSATIDTARMASYLDGAAVIKCPGRTFPVETSYQARVEHRLEQDVNRALHTANKLVSHGDILVFLQGQADINRCIDAAESSFNAENNWLLVPLYGSLSLAQQERALKPDPDGKRRIVFTTNIAETSLTIEGITCVIDSGLEKVLTFDPTSGMTRLDSSYISKASAEQRKGRAGRTQAGHCIRLWSEEKHRALRDYQGEEILSADLSNLVLELAQWGEADFDVINWLTPPPRAHYESAKAALMALDILDNSSKVTPLGQSCAGLGVSPRLAAMLLKASGDTEQAIACDLAALLSDRDIFHNHRSTDIIERLLAVQDYRADKKAALKRYPLKRAAVEQLMSSANSYRARLKLNKQAAAPNLADLQEFTGTLLLYAFPDRLAKCRGKNNGRYQLANGRGVSIFEDDPLFGNEWLVVADCDAQKKEGRVYSAAPINEAQVLDCLADHIEENTRFNFDSNKQKLSGEQITQYAAITLSAKPITVIPADVFQQHLPSIFKATGLSVLNWSAKCEDWLARAKWLGEQLDNFPKLSQQTLLDSVDEWLLPYLPNVNSIAALKKANVFELLQQTLSWDEQQLLAKEAPVEYTTPSGKTVAVIYDPNQGPTISIQLQEMFGQIESPTIAMGRVALRFELLSPARRPIQTTSDLGNFWKTSYFDVAKDMKGRYPKHRWPDEPLLEKPGRSIKARKP